MNLPAIILLCDEFTGDKFTALPYYEFTDNEVITMSLPRIFKKHMIEARKKIAHVFDIHMIHRSESEVTQLYKH